eukprot:TRINITY_DN7720_c0_g1_i1.p1 TRINITY_DN7720_c0_g1~~TRINITY_DN7720_c0_g1_i1.p1  ORF type:complete len:399 (+),score=86.57 TRINITY_DN7720_c0_g1_i1:626-1822(+)
MLSYMLAQHDDTPESRLVLSRVRSQLSRNVSALRLSDKLCALACGGLACQTDSVQSRALLRLLVPAMRSVAAAGRVEARHLSMALGGLRGSVLHDDGPTAEARQCLSALREWLKVAGSDSRQPSPVVLHTGLVVLPATNASRELSALQSDLVSLALQRRYESAESRADAMAMLFIGTSQSRRTVRAFLDTVSELPAQAWRTTYFARAVHAMHKAEAAPQTRTLLMRLVPVISAGIRDYGVQHLSQCAYGMCRTAAPEARSVFAVLAVGFRATALDSRAVADALVGAQQQSAWSPEVQQYLAAVRDAAWPPGMPSRVLGPCLWALCSICRNSLAEAPGKDLPPVIADLLRKFEPSASALRSAPRISMSQALSLVDVETAGAGPASEAAARIVAVFKKLL